MVNSGKITRNLGVFVLFLPWLSERPLSLGQSMDRIVEFFESRIRLAQWRARVLLLGLPVMLWCGLFFSCSFHVWSWVKSRVKSNHDASWEKHSWKDPKDSGKLSPIMTFLLMVGELYIICWYMFTDLFLTQIESVFSLTDFENCSCQLFQSIFDVAAWWKDMCRKISDLVEWKARKLQNSVPGPSPKWLARFFSPH